MICEKSLQQHLTNQLGYSIITLSLNPSLTLVISTPNSSPILLQAYQLKRIQLRYLQSHNKNMRTPEHISKGLKRKFST